MANVFRVDLRAIVAIHRAMFYKLLDGDEDPASHELVGLFEDIAATSRGAMRARRRPGSALEENPQASKVAGSGFACNGLGGEHPANLWSG
jgi:hypothetical protein